MTGLSNTFREKDTAILNIILDHILSRREQLGLLPPTPNTGFALAVRDTANWFASQEDFEDKIHEYLGQRCAHHLGKSFSNWAFHLTFGKHVWHAETEASTIAMDMIQGINLSEIANAPNLDYLGVGSSYGILEKSGIPEFGYAVIVAYATDGSGMIVDRINKRRHLLGIGPLQPSDPLRGMAHKYMDLPTADEAGQSLLQDGEKSGYLTGGWRARFGYGGAYFRIRDNRQGTLSDDEISDGLSSELLKDMGHLLLRPDWQDVGIETEVRNYPALGGLAAHAEFVIGWRIPFDAERPAHFPPPIPIHGEDHPFASPDAIARRTNEVELDTLLGTVYQEPQPKPRRRAWWPFRNRA